MSLAKFMASSTGRTIRIIAGIALILIGLLVVKDTGGTVLAIIGLIPLLAGLFDFCLLAAIMGMPIKGSDIRRL